MTPYIRNSNCQCVRCRAHGLMVSAVLVTLGIILLLKNYGVMPIHETIPVIFLVIGCVLLVARIGSTEGHVQPGWIQGPTGPLPPQQPWSSSAVPPLASQPDQWASGAGNTSSSSEENDSQVKP